MNILLALWERSVSAWGIVDWAKLIVILCGVFAVVWVVLKVLDIKLPEWLLHIGLIVLVCIVALAAINFIASM